MQLMLLMGIVQSSDFCIRFTRALFKWMQTALCEGGTLDDPPCQVETDAFVASKEKKHCPTSVLFIKTNATP